MKMETYQERIKKSFDLSSETFDEGVNPKLVEDIIDKIIDSAIDFERTGNENTNTLTNNILSKFENKES